ncbi:MAG: hypothetical protein R3301_08310 [Saprospiraceae bacterium]|nr:hypothetical protein [Saprospiraceae bacterium]
MGDVTRPDEMNASDVLLDPERAYVVRAALHARYPDNRHVDCWVFELWCRQT